MSGKKKAITLPQGRWEKGDLGAPIGHMVSPSVRTGACGGWIDGGWVDGPGRSPRRSPADDARVVAGLAPLPGGRAAGQHRVSPVKDDANGRQYRRAIHPLVAMHERELLSKRQCDAGLAMSAAWESACRSPTADPGQPRVDTSPKPDVAVTIQLERKDRYSRLVKALPRESVAVCLHVCCEARFLRDGFSRDGHQMLIHLELLRAGLDVMADYRLHGR